MLAVLKTYFASKKKEVRTALRLKRLKNIRSKTDGSLYKVKSTTYNRKSISYLEQFGIKNPKSP